MAKKVENMTQFELNAAVFAIMYCIYGLISLLILAIKPGWGTILFEVSNGGVINTPCGRLITIGVRLFLIGTIILLVVVNVKYNRRNNSII